MAKCPKCGEQIDTLDVIVAETNLYTYAEGDYRHADTIEFNITKWKCPKCYKELDLEPDEDSATAFLEK
jgi:uncharacterized protein (UPF0212 family)